VDFNYSDMQRMLLDSAERYLDDVYTLEHRRSLRASEDGLDRDAWRTFAELGWLALAIPEDQGGLGGSMEDVAVLSTALGSKLVTAPFVSSSVLAVHLLAGAQGEHTELLGSIGAGETRVALAHDEPGERYEYSSERKTSISRSGNGLSLSGRKMLVLDAPSADKLIVTATMEGEDGLVLALVDPGADGVDSSPYPLVDGSRAADVRLDSVQLAPEAILAQGAAASDLFAEAVDRASLALLAQAVGSMEACLQICSSYLKERHQFGQPIGKFQALQHIMADMLVATHQARSALYQALSNMAGPPAERARSLSLAKLTIGEASQLVSRQGIQLHGGYGVTDEYEISHHYRRLMVIEKSYGDIDFHVRRLSA
jgi:alkylation response protein AidB-like acyl-CoA dehydrogenase